MTKNVAGKKRWLTVSTENFVENEKASFVRLPHPQNGVQCLFVLKANAILEVMKFEDAYRSWLVGNSVVSDGCLYVLTPIDPLFLVLPYLQKSAQLGKYTTLDDILVDPLCSGVGRLNNYLTSTNLANVCSMKHGEGYTVYKADDMKILNWLCKKVSKLSVYLLSSDVNVSAGAQANTYVKPSTKTQKECARFSWKIISDYVTPTLSEQVREKMNIEDFSRDQRPPPQKRQKLNDSSAHVEDYRDHSIKTEKKITKLTSKQKQLQKVNTKGMKSMNNFFKAKPTK